MVVDDDGSDGDGDDDDSDDDDDDGDNGGSDDSDEDDEDSVLSSTAPAVEATVITAAVATGDSPTLFPEKPSELYCCRATTVAPCRGSAIVVFGPG